MAFTREVVVILYGFGSAQALLQPLKNHLRSHGFDARAWPYASFRKDVPEHSAGLATFLATLDRDPTVSAIHCVGYGVGSVVVREALGKINPSKLGRVVALNSPIAIFDFLKSGLPKAS